MKEVRNNTSLGGCLGETRRNQDDDAEWTYDLFFMRRGGIFNKIGEVRRNEYNDAEWTYDLVFVEKGWDF